MPTLLADPREAFTTPLGQTDLTLEGAGLPVDALSPESSEIAELLKGHLVVLYNQNATNGESRRSEVDALEALPWAGYHPIDIRQGANHEETVDAVARALRLIDDTAYMTGEPATVTLLSIGGDGTHNTAANGIYSAGELLQSNVRLAAAEAGNKTYTSEALGTTGLRLIDVLLKGREADIYALRADITKAGQADRTLYALGCLGLGMNRIVAEEATTPAFRKAQKLQEARFGSWPLLAKIVRGLGDIALGWRGLRQAWAEPFELSGSSLHLSDQRPVVDLMIAGAHRTGGRTLGGIRTKTSMHEENDFVVSLMSKSALGWRRSTAGALGWFATRISGKGPNDHKVSYAKFSVKGVETLQADGEKRVINQTPEDGLPVDISVKRARALTALIVTPEAA